MVDLAAGGHRAARRPRARRHPDRDDGERARPGCPALFVRKQAKEYGTAKLAEGPDVSRAAGSRIIEDVITTGGAVRDATSALRELGAVVEVVVCAIDRSPAGENPLDDVGLEVRLGAHPRPARRRHAAERAGVRTSVSRGRGR